MLRGMPLAERSALALSTKDGRIIEAILSAPSELSGFRRIDLRRPAIVSIYFPSRRPKPPCQAHEVRAGGIIVVDVSSSSTTPPRILGHPISFRHKQIMSG